MSEKVLSAMRNRLPIPTGIWRMKVGLERAVMISKSTPLSDKGHVLLYEIRGHTGKVHQIQIYSSINKHRPKLDEYLLNNIQGVYDKFYVTKFATVHASGRYR